DKAVGAPDRFVPVDALDRILLGEAGQDFLTYSDPDTARPETERGQVGSVTIGDFERFAPPDVADDVVDTLVESACPTAVEFRWWRPDTNEDGVVSCVACADPVGMRARVAGYVKRFGYRPRSLNQRLTPDERDQ